MVASRSSKFTEARRAAASLGVLDYAATLALVAVYAVGTSIDNGPGTSVDFYRSAATVIPSLLIAVAVQGTVLQLALKPTFRHQYRTVLLAIVVFGGETGALMTIARDKTNWAAHLYVYLALLSLGLTLLYQTLRGAEPESSDDAR
jgi:predicted membrane channel-forming protein YqfA (hemolysin III family)